MKLILSRKGFDSENGGYASPIFPNGSMVSLPIPLVGSHHTMSKVPCRSRGVALGDFVADVSRRKTKGLDANTQVHLDPFLNPLPGKALRGWRPAFGQDGSAQGHLRNEGVGKGDLFLFFGWFKEAGEFNGVWRYKPKSRDLHVLYGWLQIERILNVDTDPLPSWLSSHPHIQDASAMKKDNTVYVATEGLQLGGIDVGVAGGGTFDKFRPCLQLTAQTARGRSDWELPHWFHPSFFANEPTLSYHRPEKAKQNRWRSYDGNLSPTRLQSVPKGQEFVIDLGKSRCKPALEWLRTLFDRDAPISPGARQQ